MISGAIESILLSITAPFVAEVVCITIFLVFILGIVCSKRAIFPSYVSYTPTLLTSLGILGTFTGIVIGLLYFDQNDIDGSIKDLLLGLKTAFVTSLFGILLSLLFKTFQSFGWLNSKISHSGTANTTSPEDIFNAINKQNDSIEKLVHAIGGDTDSSLVSQIKLFKNDVIENQKQISKYASNTDENISRIVESLNTQKTEFKQFSDTLWEKMQDFADVLSKSATETVIEALKQVITDFNNNLTEQFGENFKQLNESVKELVTWQENYKTQIADMVEQYKQGVVAITATETSVTAISNESQAIPKTMNDLQQVMTVNQHQLSELERHLSAFKDIKDRAVEAVPEIRKQVDETVKTISDSVLVASEHYSKLLQESDKYIQNHITSSNDLLDSFVSKTSEGIDGIGKKLTDSATQVERVITEGATEFRDSVQNTNGTLRNSATHLTEQTEVIKNHLKDTVDDLNQHVRDMINGLVSDSKMMSTTLTDANKNLIQDTESVRTSVVKNIETMQQRFESSLDDVMQEQQQHMHKVFSNIDAGLKEQVSKTGEVVEKQLGMIDQSMQQEINRTMNEMGKALGQISNQFVNDYSRLVSKMDTVLKQAV